MTGHITDRGISARTGERRLLARYRGADGKERSKTFSTKRDAQRWLDARAGELATGDWIAPERGRVTFAEMAQRWLDTHTGRPSTIAGYRSVLNRHVLPRFGDRRVASIERADLRLFVADLTDSGLKPSTARNALNVCKGVLSFAVESGALRASPAARVEAPRGERHEMQVATEQQVGDLADAVGSEYAVMIYTAAYTGLRAGELAALRVRDLDFMRSRLHVRQAVAEVHGELVYGPPKSGKQRTVSLPRFLRDMLTEHVATYADDPDALVFRSPTGGPLRHGNFYRRHFRPAADAVGLEGFRFHDLRHTCAAFLIASGAHPRALMERLGHHSIAVTLDTYGHLLPTLDDSLTDALEDRFRAGEQEDSRTTRGLIAKLDA